RSQRAAVHSVASEQGVTVYAPRPQPVPSPVVVRLIGVLDADLVDAFVALERGLVGRDGATGRAGRASARPRTDLATVDAGISLRAAGVRRATALHGRPHRHPGPQRKAQARLTRRRSGSPFVE